MDGVGQRQSYALTYNGLVKRTHFNAEVLSRAKAARELHKQMGHPSDLALGNALDHGAYPELNITSRDLIAANDYYGACNACLEGKMTDEEPEPAAPVAMVRNPMFPGEGGKEDWRETLRNNKRNMEIYKRDKCHAWAYIMQHIDESIEDKLVVMNDYDIHYTNHNVLFLWNSCREIATGVGAQSAGVVLSRAFKLALVNDGWSNYFKEVKDARRAFDRLEIPAEQLKSVLWNAIFMIGMSAEGNTILRTELDNVMSQPVWPDMDLLIGRWTIMLTAKDTMVSTVSHGAIQAYATSNSGPRRKPVHKSTRCINCGKPGHMYSDCEEPMSTCGKCSGTHHTSMHEQVQSLRRSREERLAKAKLNQKDAVKPSPKDKINQMALKVQTHDGIDADDTEALQYEALVVLEEAMKSEEETYPEFVDEDGYGTDIVIGGVELGEDKVLPLLTELDETAEPITEEEVGRAMKALRTVDNEDDDQVIFDTGCTAHILKSAEGLFDVRKAPMGSSVKGVGGAAEITHIGKMLGIGRIFVAPNGANLISISQLANGGASFRGDSSELVVEDKHGKEMFRAKSTKSHKGLYVMGGDEFRNACAKISEDTKAYFSDFVDGSGQRQSYVLTYNGLVKRTHFNADVLCRAKSARELHKQMGHPSDLALGNALDHGAYPELNLTSRDLIAANDYYGACNACLEGKMTGDPENPTDREPVREIGEYISVDLLPAKAATLGGNMHLLISKDRLSSYAMCVPMKTKETESVLSALDFIKNFYKSHGHEVKKFVFDNEAVFRSVKRSVDYAVCVYTPTDLHNKHVERLVREVKEKWRCMKADLPYLLPDWLYFEGLIAACESINCVPNRQTGPNRTAVEMVTGRRPYVRPFKFGQAGLCHSKRPDSPDLRAEWCIFLTQDLFSPSNLRVYLPNSRAIVSRRKFRATEGYPDSWNYEKRSVKLPIPREEEGNPSSATRIEDKKEDERIETALDKHMEKERPKLDDAQVNRMVLRSHSKAMIEGELVHGKVEARQEEKAFNIVPSDRDFQEYMPAKLPFYCHDRAAEEHEYPYELFTHQSYCILVNANRMSVRRALEQQDEHKKAASKVAIKAEIKQLMDVKAFQPVRPSALSEQTRKKIIPSHMFLKEKLLANGEFDKMKARLVAGGNYVDPRSVGETNAPTFNPFTVFFMLNVAAEYSLDLLTADIKGAYLIPDIVEGTSPDVHVWIEKSLSEMFVEM